MLKVCRSGDKCACPEGPKLSLNDFYNDRSAKDGKQRMCKLCTKEYSKANKERIAKRHKQRYEDNREEVNVKAREYRAKNKEPIKRKEKEYRAENKDKIKMANKRHYERNKDKIYLKNNQYRAANKEHLMKKAKECREKNADEIRLKRSAYRKDNRGIFNARNAKRRAAKLQRTVAWADLEVIKQVYADCEEINLAAATAGASERFVVDHVIPLQGDLVSGLHIEYNLDIITVKENSRKHNKFTPGISHV